MIITDFSVCNLQRYPMKHAKDLRAWDAADEYLAEFIRAASNILLVNDAFGALACASIASGSAAFHINDSWCSLRATELNSRKQPVLYSGQSIDVVLVRLPKSLSLLNAQLLRIANQLAHPVVIYFSGMQKHVSSGHLDLIKSCCAEVEYLPTQRKARMYKALLLPNSASNALHSLPMPELQLTLQNVAGVFAEQKFDVGSRFFIENFNLLPNVANVADVGCGNGLLSLAYYQQHPDARLFLVDESAAAIESARLSFSLNFPASNPEILHGDGLEGVPQVFDLILINPPFHQQNTVTTDIALSLFAQAKNCMGGTSELWVVANRHLNYQSDLKRWYRRVDVVAQNSKFIIIKAML